MKRISVLLLLLLSFILCACGRISESANQPRTTSRPAGSSISQPTPIPSPKPTLSPTPVPTPAPTPRNDKIQGLDMATASEPFSSENEILSSLYSTIQNLSRKAGWNVTQNHNPEISFDENRQELSFVRLYLTYYGDCTKAEARTAVEEYSETILQCLLAVYPDVEIDTVNICWKIPAIDDQSLYAATFWCDFDGTDLILGDGDGIIYK